MVEELKLAIKVDDDAIEQSLLKQFANAEKMANKVVLTFNNIDLDNKAIEAKFKEMQKMAGKNPIDLSIDKSSIEMLSAISKQLGNIFDIAKGKSIIDSSATVSEINKITQATKESNKAQTGSENIQRKSFTTKNKTEAYNQLKQTADVFKKFYGNEEAMHTKAGAEAAHAYYKAYEEALKKGVAQSRLESVTVDVDKDGFFNADRVSSARIQEFENFKKYGGEAIAVSVEISSLEERLLKFSNAYSKVKTNLGDAPITPEIIQDIEKYVHNLEIAESRAKDADSLGFTKEDIDLYKDSADMYLGFAIEDAIKENEKYISSLKEVKEEKEKVDETIGKFSPTSSIDDSKFEELKSDITEVRQELDGVKEKISGIDSDGFESIKSDVERTTESVKELNSELTELKSKVSDTSTGNKSNISSENITVKSYEQIEDLANGQLRLVSDIGLSHDRLIEKIKEETKAIDAGNLAFKERLTFLNEQGKVIESYIGEKDSVYGIGSKAANASKIVHTHPSTDDYGGNFSTADIYNFANEAIYNGLKEAELVWRDKVISLDFSNMSKESVEKFADQYAVLKRTLMTHFNDESEGGMFKNLNEQLKNSEYTISIMQKSISDLGGDLKSNTDLINIDDKELENILNLFKQIQDVYSQIGENTTPEEIGKLEEKLLSIQRAYKETQKTQIKDVFQGGTTSAEQEAKVVQKLAEEKRKLRQQEKQSTQSSVDKSLTDQVSAWKKIQSIREKIAKTDSADEINALQESKKYYQEQYNNANKILKANDDLYDKESQIARLEQIRLETNAKIVGYKKDVSLSSMDSELKAFNNQIPKKPVDGQRSDKFEGIVQNYKNAIDEARKYLDTLDDSPITKEVKEEWERLIDVIKKAKKEMDAVPNAARGSDEDSRMKEIDKLTKYLDKNTRISKEAREQLKGYLALLKSGDPSVNVKELHTAWTKVTVAEREAGREGKSFLDIFKNKVVYNYAAQLAGYYLSFMDIIRYGSKVVENVKEVDTALTELRKVSDATEQRLTTNFKNSAETAKELGSTISDVISATADWSRMGYNIDQSEELARISTLYKNVGDGIDIEEANNSLISTLQGFQLDVSEAESIVDRFNEVANNYAIDSAGIGEALQRSAASFNAANTDLSKSIALITATNEVVQNPEGVGTLWKTMSARIRGAETELEQLNEETDEYTKTTSKLRDLVMSLTGFDIMIDENTFKDVYEIILGIGKEWQNLTDAEQASLGEALAGMKIYQYVQKCA